MALNTFNRNNAAQYSPDDTGGGSGGSGGSTVQTGVAVDKPHDNTEFPTFVEDADGTTRLDHSPKVQGIIDNQQDRQLGGQGPGTQGQGQGQGQQGSQQDVVDAAAQPDYLADWKSGARFGDVVRNGDHSILEYTNDYNRWAKDNGKAPLDVLELFEVINGRDANKSYKQNDADEKRQANKERWDQWGNVLRQLGNFIGTLYGGPSQEIESSEELTKRQRLLRDKTLQERNAVNNNILTNILKQRAAQREEEVAAARAKYYEGQLANRQRELDIRQFNADTEKAYKEGSLEVKQQLAEIQRDLAEGKINLMQAQEKYNNIKAQNARQNGGNGKNQGYTIETSETRETPFGKITTTRTQKRTPNQPGVKKTDKKPRDYSEYEVK